MERLADVLKILACLCTLSSFLLFSCLNQFIIALGLVLLVVCSWAMFDRSRLLLSVCGFSALTLEGLDCVCIFLCRFFISLTDVTLQVAVIMNDCAQGEYPSKAALLYVSVFINWYNC